MVNRYDADGCQSAIGNYVSYEDYEALRKVASMLMENLSDDAELPHDMVEMMMDLGVLDD